MAYSPPGSSVHGIFQARILEWVAISFSMYEPASPALARGFFTTSTKARQKLLIIRKKIIYIYYIIQKGDCYFSRLVMSDSFATPWTIAHQASLSMGFPKQEYWNGLPFPSPWALPDPGVEPTSLALAGGFFSTEPPGKPLHKGSFSLHITETLPFLSNE